MEYSSDNPIIRLEKLTKIFKARDQEVTALQDIDLDIAEGEIFGIIGMSGAGKSTLVRCINMLERPTSGRVFFEGRCLNDMKPGELNITRRKIAMIFQQFNLLMQRSVLKNVRYPLELIGMKKETANARAAELLRLVGLEEKAGAYPSQLSGGQKQRVAIARALASNPRVLLCDEATSALDPKTTRQVLELLKDINRTLGITIIIITHEMKVIEEICSRVAIISDSRIAEIGGVMKVFSNPVTEAAKRLVYGGAQGGTHFEGRRSRMVRIAFDGRSSYEPVISNMVLECREPVNIMFADTKNINGSAVGQMVLQLPEDGAACRRMTAYLRNKGLSVEEVDENDY